MGSGAGHQVIRCPLGAVGRGIQPILRSGLSCQDGFALSVVLIIFRSQTILEAGCHGNGVFGRPRSLSPSTPTPFPSLFLLNWFLVPWLSGRLFILIATPQNKSLMNRLLGRAISSRLPPGSGGGAWPGSQPGLPLSEEAAASRYWVAACTRAQSSFRCSLEMGTICPP